MSFWQYLLPKHLLSNLMFKFTRWQNQKVYLTFTHWIIKTYGVDMSEAKLEDLNDYQHFNDFFTRELKVGIRPIGGGLVSPVDGLVSEFGSIQNNTLLQAKGKTFNLDSLLGKQNTDFNNFATIYLAPNDYHRIHAPLDGKLLAMDYIAGDLFSVNQTSVKNVANLFARNERVVCYFDSYTIVLIGAVFVGSMEVVWHGQITPPYGKTAYFDYNNQNITLKKGDELGRFNMGSTVILLTKDLPFNLTQQQKLKMGETIG